jgi:hypothetical protein
MRPRTIFAALSPLLLSALLLSSLGCGKSPTSPGGDPSSKTPIAAGDGQLFFVDSGCSCINPPLPAINITIDGKAAGTLPVFGTLAVNLAPGVHIWSDDQGDSNNEISITQGRVTNIHVFTNLNCGESCTDN